MKIQNTIKKLEKSGFKVEVIRAVIFIATKDDNKIKFVDNGSGDITSIETGGTFFDNLTQAINCCN